jgi:transketolase
MLIAFHDWLRPEDCFILSKGHAAGALYIALWSVGRLSEDDLMSFHRDNTLLPGHPPVARIPNNLFATGSLGHGLSLAAGTALGMRLNGLTDRVLCLTSDGEWQEGSTWEALIFATHHKLGNLSVLVDHNNLQGFGSTTEVASMAPLWQKLQGFNLDLEVIDGHDADAILKALDKTSDRPRFIVLRTIKGKGVSFMEGRMDSHYLPLSDEGYRIALTELAST